MIVQKNRVLNAISRKNIFAKRGKDSENINT